LGRFWRRPWSVITSHLAEPGVLARRLRLVLVVDGGRLADFGQGWSLGSVRLAGQVASTQAPSVRVRPRPRRVRRLTAAVRRLSQAWFLVTPR
jgi:hypothetical protein